jgi:hypothetical protein
VWVIDDAELPRELSFRRDKPTHGLVEPSVEMTLAEFQAALASTRDRWVLAASPSAGEEA